MPKNYCVIGSPIAHSLSPLIHNTLYKIYGLDCEYGKRLVTPERLEAFLASVPEEKIAGFNITMPLKQEIIPCLSFISPEANESVNTISVRADGLYGYSTDAQGFYASLRRLGMDYKNNSVVFIGAGAVTRLLCADAAEKGAKSIVIANRTIEKAEQIARTVNAVPDSIAQIKNHMASCDLLINTTPLGMRGTAQNFESFDFLKHLPGHAAVCDLIYAPTQTSLLVHAAALGLKTMNGLGMLIYQAFYSFEKWFDIMPSHADYEAVFATITEALAVK